ILKIRHRMNEMDEILIVESVRHLEAVPFTAFRSESGRGPCLDHGESRSYGEQIAGCVLGDHKRRVCLAEGRILVRFVGFCHTGDRILDRLWDLLVLFLQEFFGIEQAAGDLRDRKLLVVDERFVKRGIPQLGNGAPQFGLVEFGELLGFVFFGGTTLDEELISPNRILDRYVARKIFAFGPDAKEASDEFRKKRGSVSQYL